MTSRKDACQKCTKCSMCGWRAAQLKEVASAAAHSGPQSCCDAGFLFSLYRTDFTERPGQGNDVRRTFIVKLGPVDLHCPVLVLTKPIPNHGFPVSSKRASLCFCNPLLNAMAEQEQQSDAYYTDLLSRVDDCVAETREAGHTDNVGHVPVAGGIASHSFGRCSAPLCNLLPRTLGHVFHHACSSSRLRLSNCLRSLSSSSTPSSYFLYTPPHHHSIRQNSLVAFVGNEHSVTGATCLRDPTDS
jgi:hypothetical protein